MGEEGKRELLQNVLTFVSMYVCVDRRLQIFLRRFQHWKSGMIQTQPSTFKLNDQRASRAYHDVLMPGALELFRLRRLRLFPGPDERQ